MHRATARTHRPFAVHRDHDTQPQRPVANTHHDNVGQADQQRADCA